MASNNRIFDPYKRLAAKSQHDVDRHVKEVTANPFAPAKKKRAAAVAKKKKAARGKGRRP